MLNTNLPTHAHFLIRPLRNRSLLNADRLQQTRSWAYTMRSAFSLGMFGAVLAIGGLSSEAFAHGKADGLELIQRFQKLDASWALWESLRQQIPKQNSRQRIPWENDLNLAADEIRKQSEIIQMMYHSERLAATNPMRAMVGEVALKAVRVDDFAYRLTALSDFVEINPEEFTRRLKLKLEIASSLEYAYRKILKYKVEHATFSALFYIGALWQDFAVQVRGIDAPLSLSKDPRHIVEWNRLLAELAEPYLKRSKEHYERLLAKEAKGADESKWQEHAKIELKALESLRN